jgi:hypothetical protein
VTVFTSKSAQPFAVAVEPDEEPEDEPDVEPEDDWDGLFPLQAEKTNDKRTIEMAYDSLLIPFLFLIPNSKQN